MTDANSSNLCQVETTRFGVVDVEPERMVELPQGMVGFPHHTKYCLVQHRPDSPLHWLQSMERPDLAFVVVNPLIFDQQYNVALGRTESELLKIEDPSQIQVWVVVTIPPGHPEKMTANLKAPVIINLVNRQGAQAILDDPNLSLRQPLAEQ